MISMPDRTEATSLSNRGWKTLRRIVHDDLTDPIEIFRSGGYDVGKIFKNSDLTGINFAGSDLSGVSFDGAVLDRCIFTEAQREHVLHSKFKSATAMVFLPSGNQNVDEGYAVKKREDVEDNSAIAKQFTVKFGEDYEKFWTALGLLGRSPTSSELIDVVLCDENVSSWGDVVCILASRLCRGQIRRGQKTFISKNPRIQNLAKSIDLIVTDGYREDKSSRDGLRALAILFSWKSHSRTGNTNAASRLAECMIALSCASSGGETSTEETNQLRSLFGLGPISKS